ncbi:MAG TPA: hypothetical protein PKA37_15535, partial [Planctomycetota bacterium]|nr:hypothetical protein [Planctomycetota bacterium]
ALSVALRDLDDAHQAESAFLAQEALRSKRTESRLAPLVGVAANDRAKQEPLSLPRGEASRPRGLGLILGLMVATILLASLPRAMISDNRAARGTPSEESAEILAPTLRDLLLEESEAQEAGLHEHWELRIGTPHSIYKATEPIPLFAIAEAKLEAPLERRLEAFLLVSPAELPEEDRRQLRPQRWGEFLTTPAGAARSLPSTQDLQDALQRADLASEGQVAVDLFARDPTGEVPGWVRSNRLVLALTIDHETKTVPKQQEVAPESLEAERKPQEEKEPKKSMDGEDDPTLGEQKRMEDVELQSQGIAPLLNEGSRIRKEVKVWDSEEAASAAVPPAPLPRVDIPRPVFTRREETMREESRADEPSRRLLHRYFQALRREE